MPVTRSEDRCCRGSKILVVYKIGYVSAVKRPLFGYVGVEGCRRLSVQCVGRNVDAEPTMRCEPAVVTDQVEVRNA